MIRKQYLGFAVAVALSSTTDSLAADLKTSTSVRANYVYTDAEVGEDGSDERTSESLSISPTLGLSLQGKSLSTNASVTYEYLDRTLSNNNPATDDIKDSGGFTDYNYGLEWRAIENTLTFSVSGRQNYQNVNINNNLINDRYTDVDDLAKTSSNGAGFSFNIPNPIYFGLNASGRYNKVKSDRSQDSEAKFEDDNTTLSAVFYSGKRMQSVRWNVAANSTDTGRGDRGDLKSEAIRGSVYVGLFDDVSFVGTGSNESNTITGDPTLSDELEFESYGAGLAWEGSLGRRVEVTYNRSKEQTGEETDYVGLDLVWPFSGRTSMSANVGRRFYGESKTFSFVHAARRWKSRIGYNESLRTFARSRVSEENFGFLVCPIDSQGFVDCFVPDSPDYQLGANEEYRDLTILVPEITQEITLNKNLNFFFSYDFRRLKLSVTLANGDVEYIETGLTREESSANLNARFKVGAKTSISWNTRYQELKRDDQGIDDKTLNHNLLVNYKINRDLSANLTLGYTDRESPNEERTYKDNRISASLSWKF